MDWLRQNWEKIRNALIGVLMAGIVIIIWHGYGQYRERIAKEALREMTETQTETEADTAVTSIVWKNEETIKTEKRLADREYYNVMTKARRNLLHSEDGNFVRWNGKTYCRNNYIKAILCMGVDRDNEMTGIHTGNDTGQSDAIAVFIQDTVRGTVKILMIPRDTITPIAVIDQQENYTGEHYLSHLNLAYAYGNGRETSCENARTAVEYVLCGLRIDGYMAVDHAVVSMLNDAVGGVTVTVPMEGMETADPSFVKGETVTLSGEQAEKFVRFRSFSIDNTAYYRMEQHKEYILKFFQTVKERSRENSQTVTELFDLIQNYMVTDMAKAEYMKMVTDTLTGGAFGASDILTIPGYAFTAGVLDDFGFEEFYVDYNNAIPLILNLFYREVSDDAIVQ